MESIFLLGGVRYLISKVVKFVCKKYGNNIIYNTDPELIYFEDENKKNIFLSIVKEVLLYLSMSIPFIGDYVFALYNGLKAFCALATHVYKDDIIIDTRYRKVSPKSKKYKLDYDKKFYNSKTIIDSLILDGAEIDTVSEVLDGVKEELGREYEDNDEYKRVSTNLSNMDKLKGFGYKVKKPAKLYRDTKDKEITDIYISDEDLEKLVVKMNLVSAPEFEVSKQYKLNK